MFHSLKKQIRKKDLKELFGNYLLFQRHQRTDKTIEEEESQIVSLLIGNWKY